MLQGDAIREITLEGPGAGGIETASAVVADLVSVVGTAGTGFLQNDACWRELERLPPTANGASPFYVHLDVADQPGVLAHVDEPASPRTTSRSRSSCSALGDGEATLELVLHAAPLGAVTGGAREIAALPGGAPASRSSLPVITERPL